MLIQEQSTHRNQMESEETATDTILRGRMSDHYEIHDEAADFFKYRFNETAKIK